MKFYFPTDVTREINFFLRENKQPLNLEEKTELNSLKTALLKRKSLFEQDPKHYIDFLDTLEKKYANAHLHVANCIYKQARLFILLIKQLNHYIAFIEKPHHSRLPSQLAKGFLDIREAPELLSRSIMSNPEFENLEKCVLNVADKFPRLSSLQEVKKLINQITHWASEIELCIAKIQYPEPLDNNNDEEFDLVTFLNRYHIIPSTWGNPPDRAKMMVVTAEKDKKLISFFLKSNILFTTAKTSYEAFKVISENESLATHLTKYQLADLLNAHIQEIYGEVIRSTSKNLLKDANIIIDALLANTNFKFDELYRDPDPVVQAIFANNLKLRLCNASRQIPSTIEQPKIITSDCNNNTNLPFQLQK